MVSVRGVVVLVLLVAVLGADIVDGRRGGWKDERIIEMPGSGRGRFGEDPDDVESVGTRWAVLLAGSSGYGNYRHQADVCHAYQILRRNGVKEENIVVFMYDDIANNINNPFPGTIINHPKGGDVYHGVPKDYTGKDVTVSNFFAAILGDKSSISGGSGKVVDSGPDDHIFIYYTDHGGPGVLGMPTSTNLYANDFIETLKKKHTSGNYKKLVIYLEACESGSIFEGLLPEGLNIYVTTASNADESSWGTYCPGMDPSPPPEFDTCLGDLYSVAWMEDSEVENLKKETLRDQYKIVKKRTSNNETYDIGSHVMQYGDLHLNIGQLALYLGFDPANENNTVPVLPDYGSYRANNGVNQRDAEMIHLWHKFNRAEQGSNRKSEAWQQLMSTLSQRLRIDKSIRIIGEVLFGNGKGSSPLEVVVPTGHPLVDDWECLKAMVDTYERVCGSLTQYGMKHMRAFANLCNLGVGISRLEAAATEGCSNVAFDEDIWNSIVAQYSA